MLSIRLGDRLYSLPGKQVRHIDYVDSLTVLPMMPSWVEGLVYFNGLPILLIDVFTIFGLEQNSAPCRKCIFVHHESVDFAFRADEISRTQAQDHLPSILVLLALKTCLPFLAKPALIKPTVAPSRQANFSVLVLVSGDKTIALPSHSIDSIRRIDALPKARGGEVLIKLDDQLIPVLSLGQLLTRQTVESETYAVIIKTKAQCRALCVEHLQGFETIDQIYAQSHEPHNEWQLVSVDYVIERVSRENLDGLSENLQPRYWYITRTGQLRELLNTEHLLSGRYRSHQLSISMCHSHTARCSPAPINKQQITQGLQFFCGTESYFVPLAMVDSVFEAQDNKRMTRVRPVCAETRHLNQIPKLDVGLFFGRQRTESSCLLVIRLADHVKLILAVDRVLLSQDNFIDESWVNCNGSDPLVFFFNAAYYDERTKKWILRLKTSICFAVLPWWLKKNLVKAIQGWYEFNN